jgi:tetratricopeptide (TPR) repeat protein
MSVSASSAEQTRSTQEQNISQVDFLFKEHSEKLNYNTVVELSNEIFIQRAAYPVETLAKTYLLLAKVADNMGELETAHQFTQDGLAISSGLPKIKICLQIKLASILSAKEEYEQLLSAAQLTIDMQQDKDTAKYYLFALSYRSVALAMLNQHEKALSDLQQVEDIIRNNPSFAEHISLLTILASAHYHINNYQTALTIQLKILTLRFRLNKLENVDQTYYHLANAYYRLNRFNDAYNAYWEAKKYANKRAANIYAAYASQGLGLTLLKQKQYKAAQLEITNAKELFFHHNLAKPYLETTISLAILKNLMQDKSTAKNLLLEAEKLSIDIELTDDYIILYKLLSDIYKDSNNMNKAYFWQTEYSAALLKSKNASIKNNHSLSKKVENIHEKVNTAASEKTKQLAVKFAEQSELAASFSAKFNQQKTYILILSTAVLLLLSFVIVSWLTHRSSKLKTAHEVLEKPSYIIATPTQTKNLYQKSFNMARKYNYPLTLGYISITNWQELTFQFNKKIVAEVSREIASVINQHINEFENAGLINDGEYLLLFAHQHKEDVTMLMEKLVSALKLRFFANLGNFSVIIAYSIESPNFQDIDPYIFLSQLSDSIKAA